MGVGVGDDKHYQISSYKYSKNHLCEKALS